MEIEDILVWFSTAVFQDCILPLLLELPNHVFLNRYLKITILYTHYMQNYNMNFSNLKLRICLMIQKARTNLFICFEKLRRHTCIEENQMATCLMTLHTKQNPSDKDRISRFLQNKI